MDEIWQQEQENESGMDLCEQWHHEEIISIASTEQQEAVNRLHHGLMLINKHFKEQHHGI